MSADGCPLSRQSISLDRQKRWALELENERLRADLAAFMARPDESAPLIRLLRERDRYKAALEDIRDGLFPYRHRLSSEQARQAFKTAHEVLDDA